MTESTESILLVSVGNSRTRIARTSGGQLEPSVVMDNDRLDPALLEAVERVRGAESLSAALISSVNPGVAERVRHLLGRAGITHLEAFGPDLPVPVLDALRDRSTVGQDRLLNALGAFDRTGQACVVVDAGTAITVDFIDGAGVFQGGAIAPGLRLMARSLDEHTAALPLVDCCESLPPDSEPPFGKDTQQAIAVGLVHAARGLVRTLVDKYAEFYEAYPLVIATGGDAPFLFESDPLIDRIVPDLPLVGMLVSYRRLTQPTEEEGGS